MRLKYLELNGFKSFSKKTVLEFNHPIISIVGPNGSGKSNVVEAFRFVLGEQSMKSMRGRAGADLIFKGSKNLPKGTRASVSIFFDNSDKIFKLINDSGESVDLSYDTVSLEREVYPDGLNKYILNKSEVRLKDFNTLLASVKIGSSGHHIISQGEADRVLNASSRDRKEMVEDALGLRIYQYKIKEAERKLERTNTNMKEVSMLRRENAPHLNYLKKQVDKFEKMRELRVELLNLYKEYLSQENFYLNEQKKVFEGEKNKLIIEFGNVDKEIKEKFENSEDTENQKLKELGELENRIRETQRTRGEIERKLGRIEGMLEAQKTRTENKVESVVIPADEIKEIVSEVNKNIEEALGVENISEVRDILERIKRILEKLSSNKENTSHDIENAIKELENSKNEINLELQNLEKEEEKIGQSINILKSEINQEIERGRDKEREKFTLKVRHQELSSMLELNNIKMENVRRDLEAFDTEIKEGTALVGSEILSYKEYKIEGDIDKNLQEELKKKIERIKIKLEDSGLGSEADLMKEYKDMTERDEFLAREMEDLANSIESLKKLMIDLKEKIDIEFKDGIKKINVEFQQFFALMFGGGTARLDVVVENKKRRGVNEDEDKISEEIEEEIVFEQGVEINVSLPHKKVKELQSLSGGERSLTSIALLFAMSQVNPPPFLILDETDAALDEANSRKYGDMLERLSKHSQLIVVTHNRETMSRAGILYGVTIGSDGSSKLLSVRFDEAVQIAK